MSSLLEFISVASFCKTCLRRRGLAFTKMNESQDCFDTGVRSHALSSCFSFAGKPGHIPPQLSLWAAVELINKACCGLEVSLSLGSCEPPRPRLIPRLKTTSNFNCSFEGLFFSRLCVSVCACAGMAACGGQKRALYPTELEF